MASLTDEDSTIEIHSLGAPELLQSADAEGPRDAPQIQDITLKRLAIGNDLQGHSRSLQLLLLEGPYTSITSC